MSQFKFQNDMNNLLNLDSELKNQSKPRWQRKMENSMNGSSITMNASKLLSVSYNNSIVSAIGGSTTSTANKTPNKSVAEAKKKTPNKKSPGKFEKFGKDPEK